MTPVGVDEYLGVALGMMNMGVVEFGEMTLHDFFLKLHYYNLRETRLYRERAELTRLQTLTLVNIQLARKDKIRDPRRLWTFPWEREPGRPRGEASGESMEKLIQMSKLL